MHRRPPDSRLRDLGRVGFYAGLTRALWSLALPMTDADRRHWLANLRGSLDLHREMLARPGLREVLRALERQDLWSLPAFLATAPGDLLRVLRKRRSGRRSLPVRAPEGFPYPGYYLHDFHNQANGGLSLRSALTYEWQIRFLFAGANRLMRQPVIEAIPPGEALEVLDLGCGTGDWIAQARAQGRDHRYTAVDLSPAYLRVGRRRQRGVGFLQANAEELPRHWTSRFDVVTSIWLFHELPPEATRRVVAEAARVLRPGGRFVFLDAVQAQDHAGPPPDPRAFEDYFAEPHFVDWTRLDMEGLLARHALRLERRRPYFASVLLTGRKSTGAPGANP